MTERRKWKAEEKLAIVMVINEKDRVVETRRKFSVYPACTASGRNSMTENK